MKKFRYLLMLCVAGVVGFSAHAMPIGLRFAMMGRAAAAFNDPVKNIGLAQVEIDCPDVAYCGTAYEPAVQSVKWGDDTLVAGTDYTLAYSGNVDAGTATITLTGTNLFNGTYTTNFTIRPKPLTEGMVEAIGNHPYIGKAQTPKPTVTDAARGVTLSEDVEYTLSYANNTAIGEGIVTVTGKGNYTGSIARAFVIEPSAGSELEERLGGAGKVESDGEGGWIVTITNEVDSADLPIEIPDNLGPVTVDLNGHDLVGGDGRDGARPSQDAGEDGKPAIRIVPGGDDGEPTVLTVVTTGGDATVKGGDGGAGNPGGNGAPAIEVAEGAQDGVLINIGTGVTVQGGDGGVSEDGTEGASSPGIIGEIGTNNGTIVMPSVKVDLTLKVGEYFKATLSELGYDVPTNGTPYSVVAKGLPAGLKLKYNPAWKNKKGKVVIKAKSEWWIEGVPTAALDFFTNPPYLVITVNGQTETYALSMEVKGQEVTELDDLALGQSLNVQFYLPGVTNGWTVSGLPKGLKYTAKLLTEKWKSGKKTLITTNALPYSVYGKTTKAGLYTITAKKKVGAFYETMKYRVLVRPKAPDAALFGDLPTNLVTMAYVPVAWDLKGGSPPLATGSGTDATGRVPPALPAVPTVAKVTGLPGDVVFASANTYYDKKKTKLKQPAQTIMGTPTKPGTYVVTFTRNVKEKVKGKVKTVAKTAQILWTVEPNDVEVNLGFNMSGGVIESGVVGLKYGDLLAFSATSNATVTASGLPKGIKLVRLDEGGSRPVATESGTDATGRVPPVWWGFEGFTAKAGTYLVTVKATLKGKTVTQRVALKVEGLPAWAKGTFNGVVSATGETPVVPVNGQDARSTNGLATVTVSSAGKISGKFYEGGTNWTLSADSYTDGRARSPSGPQSQASGSQNNAESGTRDACPYQEFICSNIVAKYAYKVKEKVKGKVKTVTKYVTREFALAVSPVSVVPNVPDVQVRGFATLIETDATGRVPPEQATEPGGSPPLATEITAWQNLWGRADYKAAGKKLFYTSKKKPYKTFARTVEVDGKECALSLKVTPNGAVTATLTYDTGKTQKDKKTKKTVPVYYKPTCSTVVIPTTPADADPFAGEVPLYFAPSTANGFEGFAGSVAVP